MFRHLNDYQNPMDGAATVQAQGHGLFNQATTLRIEERAFNHVVREEGAQHGQEYKFFLVVRCTCYVWAKFMQSTTHIVRT